MDNFNADSKKFSELMQKSRLSITNESFEERLMQKIQLENTALNTINRNRKISILFFILGVLLGLVVNFSIPKIKSSVFGNINAAQFLIYFQIGFVAFILIYLEKLYHAGTLKFRGRNF